MVAGPSEGFSAGFGLGLSTAGFDFKTGGMAGSGLVVLGVDLHGGFPTDHYDRGTGFDNASV